jgi:hypothetical protein
MASKVLGVIQFAWVGVSSGMPADLSSAAWTAWAGLSPPITLAVTKGAS